MKTEKVCPICKIPKASSEYYVSFRKDRNTYRLSYSCKKCDNARTGKMYSDKKTNNPDAVLESNRSYRKKQVETLQDYYVAQQCSKTLKISIEKAKVIPGLIEVYRNKIALTRKLREYGNQK